MVHSSTSTSIRQLPSGAVPPAAGWRRRVLDDPARRKLRRELEAVGREFAGVEARRSVLVERRRAAIEAARAADAGWQEIADVLGLESRQAAQAIVGRQEAAQKRRSR